MTERDERLQTVAEVQEFLASPLPTGQARTMHCRVCGAVTYIRFSPADQGSGDPVKHVLYHRKQGETGA
jgi:hypothetical protein